MIQFDGECIINTAVTNDGSYTNYTTTYQKFSVDVDSIKEYSIQHFHCPCCGAQLELSVLPKLPLHKAIDATIKAWLSIHQFALFLILSFLLCAAIIGLVPSAREWFWNGPSGWRIAIIIYGLAAIGALLLVFLPDVLNALRLRVIVDKEKHNILYKGKSIQLLGEEANEKALKARIKYYSQ